LKCFLKAEIDDTVVTDGGRSLDASCHGAEVTITDRV